MAELRIAVAGAGGRMGAANIRAVSNLPGLKLVAAFERPGSPYLGQDSGLLAGLPANDIAITDDRDHALSGAEAILDFTAPASSVSLAAYAARHAMIHIIGTTGCSPEDDAAIVQAAMGGARIVKSGNFSLGVNVLAALVRQAAKALADYDIEILEMHHNRKVDAPSGTALLLGEAAAGGRQIELADSAVRVRDGHTGPRVAGTIGFAALRGGTVVGEHTVMLAGLGERIELSHRAEDRGIFAHGAARAALWAANQPPGLYSMADLLGL